MANEITFGHTIGATLTYGAYEPDGTVRTAAGTSLPEVGATGYYKATDANIQNGDKVIVKNAAGAIVGWGEYQPEVDAVLVEGSDATDQINAACDTAFTDYDPPTNMEMEARTILAADYFDPSSDAVANVTTVGTLTGHTVQTGDSYAIVNNGTYGLSVIETLVDEVETLLKDGTYGLSAIETLVDEVETLLAQLITDQNKTNNVYDDRPGVAGAESITSTGRLVQAGGDC